MTMTLTFLGAAGTVTGSRYLVRTPEANVLVDCGMFQERENLSLNWENFGVYPPDIDAVLLTHGHMDHSGWLPKLAKDGFRGKAFCTPATADLVPIIVRDIAKIQEEDARTKAKRHAKEGRKHSRPPVPLYGMDDAEKAVRALLPVKPGAKLEIARGVFAEWGENGHILGAAWIRLSAGGKEIVFSGDVGRWGRPILRDPQPPDETDYLVIESTYGDRDHTKEDAGDDLADAVRDSAGRGGNLLIPSFSVERAQELLYALAKLEREGRLPHKAVYLDSPMSVKVTELFSKHPEVFDKETAALARAGKSPFDFPKLRFTGSVEESKAINEARGGVVIIAGNGMCTGGRIKHHLVQNLWRPEATVLFVGYQAAGTLGRQLVEGAREVRLFNRPVDVRAQTRQIAGMSGHADRNELLRWARAFTKRAPAKTFVTHGDPGAASALAAALGKELGWRAETPAFRDCADL